MPISGNEESGVIARQSRNFSVGVPIKKRRFPLVQFPSPPPREPSSILAESDSLKKEHSNQSQEPSLSNASVATNSPSASDAKKTDVNKTSSVEVKEGPDDTNANSVQNNVPLRAVKLEEPNLKICSGRMDNMDSEEKLMFTDRSDCQKIPRNTQLHLARGEGIHGKQEVEGCSKFEISAIPANVELSLRMKEPLVPDLAVQSSEGSFQVLEKSDPSLLCLSLSKEKPFTQCKSDDNLNHDSSHLHANRSNWDLNTTMDTWEGPAADATACQGTVGFDGLNDTGSAHDIKTFSRSTGMVGVGVDLGKQILGAREHISKFTISTLTPSELYKSEDSLHVGLSMSCFQSNFSGEHSGPSAKVDLGKVVPYLLGGLVSSRKVNSVGSRTVKSEPLEENAKHNFVGENDSPMGLFNFRTLKRELVERCNPEAVNLLSPNTVEHRSIKSEPVQEGNQEIHKTAEMTSCQLDGKVHTEMVSTPQKLFPSVLHSCSTELTISGDVSNQSQYTTYTKEVKSQEECGSSDRVVSEMVSVSVGRECKESNVSDGMTDARRAEDLNVEDLETGRLKLMDELPLASCGNGEGSVSDEEKINISADMLEEDSYASDYESDGYHNLVAPLDTEDRQYAVEDDEYEDGEVREPLVHNAIEGPIGGEMKEADVTLGDCGNKDVCALASPGDSGVVQSCVEKDSKMKYHGETSDDHIKECVDIVLSEKTVRVVDKDGFLQDSSTSEVVTTDADEKEPIKTIQRKPLDQSGNMEVQNVRERHPSTDGATNRSQGTVRADGEAADGNIEGTVTFTEGKDDSTLLKTESTQIEDDAAKDANSGGNRSRIIKLPRASNVSSPVKTIPIPVRSLPLQTERERYTGFDRERFYPRRNRDEMYLDGPRRIRERFQDQPSRNFRPNFMRGRGRSSSRLDTLRGDWDNDSEFASENFNGSVNYRFPRGKRASAGADAELEYNGYIFAPDGAIVGTDRGGRKPYNDEFPSFRHPRRPSPGGRDGAARQGIQMVRRIPGNINMARCVGEDGSDFAGIKHGEKFLRGLANDILDPVFSRPQPPYEGADGQFVRGNRNFSTLLRRGVPRIRSKSPIRSRTNSPGTWLSPRRSPDGLNGLPEMTNGRSPGIYRIERMRSPDHHFFPEEIVVRRHGSPPYMSRPSNNLRDMDAGREHGHPRSIIPNRRSPSDRVLPRGTRRLDIVDTRERTDKDAYFGRPMQSGRLHELGCDGSGDEIRMRGVRRGPVRSFRPPYSDADGENFSFPVEDGPRPFRFRPEADSEFLERNNLRERVSDRRIESRPINAPRRMRSIEEQEGNYRHGGQVWHDNGFDDASRVKRRRF